MPALRANAGKRCGTRTRRGPWRLNNKLFAGLSDSDGRRTVGIRAGIRKDTSNLCFPRPAASADGGSDPTPKRTPHAEISSQRRQPAQENRAQLFTTSVPVLTFVPSRGGFVCECQNQRDTRKYFIFLWFFFFFFFFLFPCGS